MNGGIQLFSFVALKLGNKKSSLARLCGSSKNCINTFYMDFNFSLLCLLAGNLCSSFSTVLSYPKLFFYNFSFFPKYKLSGSENQREFSSVYSFTENLCSTKTDRLKNCSVVCFDSTHNFHTPNFIDRKKRELIWLQNRDATTQLFREFSRALVRTHKAVNFFPSKNFRKFSDRPLLETSPTTSRISKNSRENYRCREILQPDLPSLRIFSDFCLP